MADSTSENPSATSGQTSDPFSSAGAQYDWNAMAIHPIAGFGVIVGIFVAVLTGFLSTLAHASEDPATGMIQTAIWFNWIALTLIAVSLVLGSLVSKSAHAGIRVAMVAIGLFVLLASIQVPMGPINIPGFF